MGVYIPKALQRLDNWVLWRLENGKKKPYSARYDGLASVAKPYQWSDYESARTKLQHTDYNGLGFVFSAGCGLVFIDLDNCIDSSGEPNGFASEIIELFSSSYIEYSQSGNGLHIVCKGVIPAAYKSEQIELYSSGRYMAFTGDCYTANEPQDAQAALDTLCKRFNITAQDQRPQIKEKPVAGSDKAIIDKAQRGKHGAQFRRLWAGDWSNYETQSQADMRLIALLWYYSGNVEQVARLFQASGLAQRDKAQREDYIKRTIETAARNASGSAAGGGSVADRRGSYTAGAPKQQQRQHKQRSYWNK